MKTARRFKYEYDNPNDPANLRFEGLVIEKDLGYQPCTIICPKEKEKGFSIVRFEDDVVLCVSNGSIK